MNKLSTEKRVKIIGTLAEGMSLRAISRVSGASITTVTKLLTAKPTTSALRPTLSPVGAAKNGAADARLRRDLLREKGGAYQMEFLAEVRSSEQFIDFIAREAPVTPGRAVPVYADDFTRGVISGSTGGRGGGIVRPLTCPDAQSSLQCANWALAFGRHERLVAG